MTPPPAKKVEKKRASMEGLLQAADAAFSGTEDPHSVLWYPTGLVTLDSITANGWPVPGGFPASRIIHLYGGFSTGKSTLAMQAAVQAQKQGRIVFYMDYEHSFVEAHALSLGLDTTPLEEGGLFKIVHPTDLENGFDMIYQACTEPWWKERIGAFIFDSVAGAKSEHMKDSFHDHNKVALEAGQWSTHLPRIAAVLKQTHAMLVLVNQTRVDPNAGIYGNPETTPGGNAIKFWASLMIGLKRAHKIEAQQMNPFTGKVEKTPVGNMVRFRINKNKLTGQLPYEPLIPSINNLGFDNMWDCIDHAKNLKLVEVGGTGYITIPAKLIGTTKDLKEQGSSRLAAALNADTVMRDAFVTAVDTVIRANFAQLKRDRDEHRGLVDMAVDGEGMADLPEDTSQVVQA